MSAVEIRGGPKTIKVRGLGLPTAATLPLDAKNNRSGS
jgi:hypothetical protein